MTLVVAATSPAGIWMLTDRRLSRSRGDGGVDVISDEATKVFSLETLDGRALIGYAGLGATAEGTEPSDWMLRVLRGGKGTVEQALSALHQEMNQRLLPHLDLLVVRSIK